MARAFEPPRFTLDGKTVVKLNGKGPITLSFKEYVELYRGFARPLFTAMNSDLANDVRHVFDDVQRFRYAWASVQTVQPVNVFRGKDAVKADEALNQGRKHLHAGSYDAAWAAFNEALLHAPWEVEGARRRIAAIHAGRSAALVHKERYAEAIGDIDQAVSLGSFSKVETVELLMRKARILNHHLRYDDSFTCLTKQGAEAGFFKKEMLLPAAIMSNDDVDPLKRRFNELLRTTITSAQKWDTKTRKANARPIRPAFEDLQSKWGQLRKLKFNDGRNEEFIGMSGAFRFEDSEEFKWGFVAKKDVKPGELILKEASYNGCLFFDRLRRNCYSCYVWCDVPHPCKKCAAVMFCSLDCARSPRAKLHLKECEFWLSFCPFDVTSEEAIKVAPPNDVMLAAATIMTVRTVLTKTPEEWLKFFMRRSKLSPGDFDREWLSTKLSRLDEFERIYRFILNHCDRFDASALMDKAYVACYVWKLLQKYYLKDFPQESILRDCLGAFILRHLLVYPLVCTNVMETPFGSGKTDEVGPMGLAFHPTLELFVPSCTPNVIAAHFGDILVVCARRPIKKGEMLSRAIHYGYHSASLEDRRSEYRKKFFECSCDACKHDWPMLPVLLSDWNMLHFQLRCPFCGAGVGEARGAMLCLKAGVINSCYLCGRSGEEIITAVNSVMLDVQRMEWKFEKSVDMRLRDVFDVIEKVNRICSAPCGASLRLEDRAFRMFLRMGNKRFYSSVNYADWRAEPKKPAETPAGGAPFEI